jgi:RHS repeat-associated protein
MWSKWSGTHQVSRREGAKTVLGIVIDANGNTLTDPSGKSYSWDFENRMTQVVVPGTGTVAFKYDPFGRRIYKSSPNFTGIFAYDGGNLIETANSSGTVLASYTQGENLDEPLAELRSGGSSYYEADGLGSITSLSISTGTVANTYAYDSFGNLTNFTGTLKNPFQYASRESDPETSLYYNRARYYNPGTGRFLSEDPIRFYGGNNFYRYVLNNPVNFIDPTGLQEGTAIGCLFGPVGCGVGATVDVGEWLAPAAIAGMAYYSCKNRGCSCTAKCACHVIGTPNHANTGSYVYGSGTASSCSDASALAKADAGRSCPAGSHAQHCDYQCKGK